MANVNLVVLIGNLTRDPELKMLPSNTAVCEFGMAVNRNWTDGSGEKKEEVTFVDVTAFGKLAETLSQYVKKGSPLYIQGRLKLDQWEDKEGGKRSKLRVIIDSFQFLASKRNEEQGEYAGEPTQQAAPKPTQRPAPRPANRNAPADASMKRSNAEKLLDPHPSDNDVLEDAELPF